MTTAAAVTRARTPDTDTDTDADGGIDGGADGGVGDGGVVIGAEWTELPAGSFWMGTPAGTCPTGYTGSCTAELGRQTDETLHYVTLTHSFEMQRTEVTQGDFAAVMGWNPSSFSSCGTTCPVEEVSWYDAAAYANELSLDAALTPCYVLTAVTCNSVNHGADYMACMNSTAQGIDSATVALNGVATPYACTGYRLPTESEWEYAIRAGSATAFYPSASQDGTISSTSNDPNLNYIAWYYYNGYAVNGSTTYPAASKEANAWGLYDMSGNVWEWTWDWYSSTYPTGTVASPAVDPTGAASASGRAFRGGGWGYFAGSCRSGFRIHDAPGFRYNYLGFRLSRSL